MSLRQDVINLIVNVNGDTAQNQLNELRKKAGDLGDEMVGLKKKSKEYIDANENLKAVTAKMVDLRKEIGLTSLSLKELDSERARLTALVKSSVPLSTEFKEYEIQLKAVIARQAELNSGIKGFQQVAHASTAENLSFAGSFGKIFERAAEYLSAYKIIEGLTELIKGTGEAAIEAEVATFRFKGTLDNLGRVDAFDRLSKAAEDLHEKFSFFGKPEIIGVFEQLVTFGKLSENQINELTPVIINFAAKSGLSLKEATTSILSALEGNGRGLKQFGINIKDAKTEADRFGVIMNELAPKVEGAAAAFGDTTQGNIEKTKIRFKELQEEIGNKLLPTINDMLSGFNSFLKVVSDDGIGGIFDRVSEGFLAFVKNGKAGIDELKRLREADQAAADAETPAQRKILFTQQFLPNQLPANEYGLGQQKQVDPNMAFDGGTGLSTTTKAELDAEKKKQEELLKEAESFRKKIDDLVFQSGEASKSQDQKEIDSTKRKFDEILKDYDALVKKLNAKGKEIIGPREPIVTAEKKALDDLTAKQQQTTLTKSYDEQQTKSLQFYEEEKTTQTKRFVDREISQKVYESNIQHIEAESKNTQLDIAEQYSKATVEIDGKDVPAVKKAVEDTVKLKREGLAQETKDLVDAYKAQETERKLIESLNNASATAKIQTKIIVAQNSGNGDAELKAQKELIDEELKQKTAALEEQKRIELQSITETGIEAFALSVDINKKTNDQKAADDAAAAAKKEALDLALRKKKNGEAQALSDQIFTIGNAALQAETNLAQRQIANEAKVNNAKAAQYKKLLDAKLISQKQYDTLIAKQDADLAKKKHAADVKAFKRGQEMAITQALINGALGISATYAARPGFEDIFSFGVARAVEQGLVIASTLAQVAVIASESPPSAGKGKLLSDGPYHSDPEKGLHVVNPRTGKTELLLEKDEMVIKGSATRSNEQHTITGTPAQIGSKINSMYGGVTWAPGAHVERPRFATQRPPAIITNMPRIMEQGGVIRPLISQAPAASSTNDISNILAPLIEGNAINAKNNELMQTLIAATSDKNQQPIKTYVTIKDYNAQQARYDAAQKASGIN